MSFGSVRFASNVRYNFYMPRLIRILKNDEAIQKSIFEQKAIFKSAFRQLQPSRIRGFKNYERTKFLPKLRIKK